MNIAYIILAHRYPDQLIRLVRRLNTQTASFFIHVDKRTDDEIYRRAVSGLRNLSNVYFLKRHVCHWGDFGHVKGTIQGIRELSRSHIPFDVVVLLTGQDYPIKSNSEIVDLLRQHQGKSFIEYFPLPFGPWKAENGGFDRIDYWHVRFLDRCFVFPAQRSFAHPVLAWLWTSLVHLFPKKRTFPKGFTPFGGSAYWCLSRECVEYVHDFISRSRSFVRFFKYVRAPSEFFFQTIIAQSPLIEDKIINAHLRHIEWPGPRILGKDDFDKLACSPALFARKFDATRDAEIIDMIDRQLLTKHSPPP